MAVTFLTAALSFVSTNIDDIFVLTLLYAQARSAREIANVAAGQFLGIGFLTLLGVLGAWGTQLIPSRYIGLLGFIPLFLGIRAWRNNRRARTERDGNADGRTAVSIPGVALLTIANGADNVGVYIPAFSGYSAAEFAVTFGVFAAMVALWCFFGFKLASYPYIKQKLARYQHILVPAVLIALGLSILARNYLF